MEIPQNIDKSAILSSPVTAELWMLAEVIRFAQNEDKNETPIDLDVKNYTEALVAAFCVIMGGGVDNDKIIDMHNFVNMLVSGVQALVGMGYALGYQAGRKGVNDA